MSGIIHLARKVIEWLRENKDLIILVGIPVLLLLIDLVLRAALNLDLVDVGADMALLSVSAFVSSLTEDTRPGDTAAKVALLLFFFILWLICLVFTSSIVPIIVQIRLFIALGFGLMSFILASIFLAELAGPSIGSS